MAKKNKLPFDIGHLNLGRPVRRQSVRGVRFVVRDGDIIKEIVDLSKKKGVTRWTR